MTSAFSEQELDELRKIALNILDGGKKQTHNEDWISSKANHVDGSVAQEVRIVRIKKPISTATRRQKKQIGKYTKVKKRNSAKVVISSRRVNAPIFAVEEVGDIPISGSELKDRVISFFSQAARYLFFLLIYIIFSFVLWFIITYILSRNT